MDDFGCCFSCFHLLDLNGHISLIAINNSELVFTDLEESLNQTLVDAFLVSTEFLFNNIDTNF